MINHIINRIFCDIPALEIYPWSSWYQLSLNHDRGKFLDVELGPNWQLRLFISRLRSVATSTSSMAKSNSSLFSIIREGVALFYPLKMEQKIFS